MIEEAESAVDLMYMHKSRPNWPGAEDFQKQLNQLLERAKKKDISIRQIIRLTPKTWPWIKESILAVAKQNTKASIGLFFDKDWESDTLPTLCIQRADQIGVILTAIAEQEQTGIARDLYCSGPGIAEIFREYYNRLWRDGRRVKLIIDRGDINISLYEEVENEYRENTRK
jgi:hypothetical protein